MGGGSSRVLYPCYDCPYESESRYNLTVHVKREHPSMKCSDCQLAFHTADEVKVHFEDNHAKMWCSMCCALGKRGDEAMVYVKEYSAHQEEHTCEHNGVKGLCHQCLYPRPDWVCARTTEYNICFIGPTCTGKTSCWNLYAGKQGACDSTENKEKEQKKNVTFSDERGDYVVCVHDIAGISLNNKSDTYVAMSGARYSDATVAFIDSTSNVSSDLLSVVNELMDTGFSQRILVVAGKVDQLIGNCDTQEEVDSVVEAKLEEIRANIKKHMSGEGVNVNVVPLWQGPDKNLRRMDDFMVSYLKQTRKNFEKSIIATVRNAERADRVKHLCCICQREEKMFEACYSFSGCGHLCLCEQCSAQLGADETQKASCPLCRTKGTMVRQYYRSI